MLERISKIEGDKQYVVFDESIHNQAEYFALSDEDNDGWQYITYYTPIKKDIYSSRNGDYNSWVYILSNPSLPGMLKIGYTNLTPDKRANQISSSTGVPTPFKVEFAFNCFDGYLLEADLHRELKSFRVNNGREFFSIDLEIAKEKLEMLGKKYTK